MGLFDQIKNKLEYTLKSEARNSLGDVMDNVSDAAVNAIKNIGKGGNSSKKFKFDKIPETVDELKALPEAKLDTAFKTTALVMLALMRYEQDPETTLKMLDFLKGPDDTSNLEKQFLSERLNEKQYKVASFFEGAKPENDYKPSVPYTITVYENPYSFDTENWAVMYVQSSGTDGLRPIKLRKKPSTGQWFIKEIQCLEDIRIPVSSDPWA